MDSDLIALLALILSVALAGWEFVKYLLEGGRVRVTLRAGLHTDYSLAWGKTWKSLARNSEKNGGWPVEVAVVEVENLGRTAVTVSYASLDVGRANWWKLGRHTIGPRPLASADCTTERSVRLEPFDSVRWAFDVWRVIEPTRDDDVLPRPFRILGAVKVAGKRRRRVSPRRLGWVVKPGLRAFIPRNLEVGLVAHRAAWREVDEENDLLFPRSYECIKVAIAVRDRFPITGPAPTADQLEQVFAEAHVGDGPTAGMGLLAFYMERDLAPFYERSPAAPEPGPVG